MTTELDRIKKEIEETGSLNVQNFEFLKQFDLHSTNREKFIDCILSIRQRTDYDIFTILSNKEFPPEEFLHILKSLINQKLGAEIFNNLSDQIEQLEITDRSSEEIILLLINRGFGKEVIENFSDKIRDFKPIYFHFFAKELIKKKSWRRS